MSLLGYELRKTEPSEPGKKTSRIGWAKGIVLVAGIGTMIIDALNEANPNWADAAPWFGVTVLLVQILGMIGNFMQQDKKFNGANTASRAVFDETPEVLPEVAEAIRKATVPVPPIAPEIAAAIADNVAKAIQKSRDEEKLRELMQRDAEKRAEAGIDYEGG